MTKHSSPGAFGPTDQGVEIGRLYLDGFAHAHLISKDATLDVPLLLLDSPGQELFLVWQQGHEELRWSLHLLHGLL